jgi:DNA-binding XRE family transcriptional regulator
MSASRPFVLHLPPHLAFAPVPTNRDNSQPRSVYLVVSLRYAQCRPSPRVSHERATSPIRCLRQLRRQQDLTQEQRAEAAGISVEMLSNIERGVNALFISTQVKSGQDELGGW